VFEIINAECLSYLESTTEVSLWHTIFADPPDNIGLKYGSYADNAPQNDYTKTMRRWIETFIDHAETVWLSYNAKWTFEVGAIVKNLLDAQPFLNAKACVQTFTFGQHNQKDLGNNHRPLIRLQWNYAKLYPDAIRIPSWRQENDDKRADPRGRVPGDAAEFNPPDTKPLPIWAPQDIIRFLAKVQQAENHECWEWTAGKTNGYGQFRIGTNHYRAPRLMWRLAHGSDPMGSLVLHACDNPGCCNPSHLFLGSASDNSNDMKQKGRAKLFMGEEHGQAKLSDEAVIEIYCSSETCADLARKHGVSSSLISRIRTGKNWTHVTRDLPLSDVFRFSRVTGNSKQRRKFHPTQLHEGLVERCLKLTTPPGGSVLDPFGGTGTTLRVCRRLGFDCTLVEIDPFYCEKIREEHS